MPPREPSPFNDQALAFLVVGETTRNAVDAHFSGARPDIASLSFENDRVRTYAATAGTWSDFFCTIHPYGFGCGSLFPRREVHHYLTLRFRRDGVLERFGVSKYGCDVTAGFCATYDSRETMAIDVARDLPIPVVEAGPSDSCTVYIYTEGPFWTTPVVSVTFDEQRVGWLIEEAGYFQLMVAPGPHRIELQLTSGLSHPHKPVRFGEALHCNAGEERFVFVKQRWSTTSAAPKAIELRHPSTSVGAREIERRWRVLFRD